jgi:hypothetical protein
VFIPQSRLSELFIDKDLGRNELDVVFPAGFGIFPDIIEDDLDLAGEFRGDLLHDRLHGLAGDAFVRAELQERHDMLGEVDVQAVGDEDEAFGRCPGFRRGALRF